VTPEEDAAEGASVSRDDAADTSSRAPFAHDTAAAARLLSNVQVEPTAAEPASTHSESSQPANAGAFAEQLHAIRQMLENLTTSSRPVGAAEIPAELFELYAELIDAEVEDNLAREFILKLKEYATPAQLQDPNASRALLTAMVESDLRVGGPIAVTPGQRKVVALVGSTGVGKTTTIAKLAANFRLRDGIKMGLVTVDTYRIAAVEQLRTYAEIIDLPMKVVTNPLEMRRVMDELVGLDLVLIDTAGRSPRDELQIQELKRLLAEAGTNEVHVVLSLTSSLRTLAATVEKFQPVGTTGLILTKLDEAAGMGTLLSLARQVPLPVNYLTTGQDVPDDIEPANKTRMARLILGQERA
jgi:flagellar biosynthesis protein FlhF